MAAALVVIVVLLLVGGSVGVVALRRTSSTRHAGSTSGRGTIDPFTINEPWRRFVQNALQARSRFDDAVAAAEDGPLRERLTEIARSLDAGVRSTWDTAQQGQRLRDARRGIDVAQVRRQLEKVRRQADPNAEATARSLEAQLEAAARLDAVRAEAESKLTLMTAQLDEAVAQAAELSVRAGDATQLSGIESEIAEVAMQMEALRLALEEANRLGGTGPAGA